MGGGCLLICTLSVTKSFHRFTYDLGSPHHLFQIGSYIFQLKIVLLESKVDTNLQG